MLRTTLIGALALMTLTGAAQADDHRRWAAVPGGPQPIADVLQAGGGTAAGTVSKVAATWFVLDDGRDRIDVTTKGLLPEGLQPGQQVTVVGGVRQGAIRASQIIRDDGSAFGRDASRGSREGREDRRHRDRHHDDD